MWNMKKWLLEFWKYLIRKISFRKLIQKKKKRKIRLGYDFARKSFSIRPTKKPLYIQVGLDFGTNCSKACYSVSSSRKVFPVIFGHKLLSYPKFVMPAVAMFNSQRKILIGENAAAILENQKWGNGLRNFKTLLAAMDDSFFKDEISEKLFCEYIEGQKFDFRVVDPYIVTAIYIAYLMHTIRRHIVNKFKTEKLDINFNICIPIDYIEKNKVKNRFENAFALAAAIEKRWKVYDDKFDPLRCALLLKDKIRYDEKCPETRVFAIPETVAEVVSYLKSFKKKTGMHALIDIGSGTTDVSIFNLTRTIEERSYWYAARVIPFGVFNIEKILINCLEKDMNYTLRFIFEIINNMNSKLQKFENFLNCTKDELNEFFSSKEYKNTWTEAYCHLKKERFWRDVKIFISGGGSQLPYVKDFSSKPWWSHIEGRYEVEFLTKPDDFEITDDIPFYRMAVAYGLTWPKPLLRGYILPKDAPNHTPPPLSQREMPDVEELYPK